MMDLLPAILGGVLIGGSAAGLLLVNGRVAGISGILGHAVRGVWGQGRAERWRLAFLAGLILAGVGARLLHLPVAAALARLPLGTLVMAGLLVGVGTRIGSGQVQRFFNVAMRVDIDGQDALTGNLQRQPRRLLLGAGRVEHPATAKSNSASRRTLQEIPAGGHLTPPWTL